MPQVFYGTIDDMQIRIWLFRSQTKDRIQINTTIKGETATTNTIMFTNDQLAAILPTLIKAAGSLRTLTSLIEDEQK